MASRAGMFLAAQLVLLALCHCGSAKTLGLKPEVEEKKPQIPTFQQVTEYMLSNPTSEEDANSDLEERIEMLREAFASGLIPEVASSKSHRSKRSLGFFSRLGSCLLTFWSNPSCFSRLTRAQIEREERKQEDLRKQEAFRQNMQDDIYNNYLSKLNATTGTGDDTNEISAGGDSQWKPPRPTTEAPYTTTTRRPLFPLLHNIKTSIRSLFPRFFSFFSGGRSSNYDRTYDDSSRTSYFSTFGTRSRADHGWE